MGGSVDELDPYEGVFVTFSGDPVQVRGYFEARTTFGEGSEVNTINIRYMVVNIPSSYNILLGRPTINKLGAVVSLVHMKMKYLMDRHRVGVIRVNQRSARKCYEGSLKNNKKRCWQLERVDQNCEEIELDPKVDYKEERPQPAEETKTIELQEGRMVKIGSQMGIERDKEVIECLRENVRAFAWTVQDMPGIDPDFI